MVNECYRGNLERSFDAKLQQIVHRSANWCDVEGLNIPDSFSTRSQFLFDRIGLIKL